MLVQMDPCRSNRASDQLQRGAVPEAGKKYVSIMHISFVAAEVPTKTVWLESFLYEHVYTK